MELASNPQSQHGRLRHTLTRSFVQLTGTMRSLLLTLCASSAYAQSVTERDWQDYPDFSALRNDIGWSDDFTARCDGNRPNVEIVDFINSESWPEAIELGLSWLERCPIDIRIHYFVAISMSGSGSEEGAETHFRWFEGLMNSIVASGDGETPETPYVTISVAEEYDALYFFGLEVTDQSLVEGDVLLDAFTAKNDDGAEFTIYFSPAAHFARLERLFR